MDPESHLTDALVSASSLVLEFTVAGKACFTSEALHRLNPQHNFVTETRNASVRPLLTHVSLNSFQT